MARVIKQGRCTCHFLNRYQFCPDGMQQHENDSFDTLFCQVPDARNSGGADAGNDQPGENKDAAERQAQDSRAAVEAAEKEVRALKKEAEDVLAAARTRAVEIESHAYAQGYEQGQKDGEEIGRRQFSVGLQHLESVLENLKKETGSLAPKYEAQMVKVCLLVAGKLLERELTSDGDLISRVLKASLKKAVEGSSIIVHLSPRDRENLDEEFLSRLSSPGGNRIKVRENATVKRGGCLIETEFGLIDGSLESRWNAMVETINQTLKERTGVDLGDGLKRLF